MGPRFKSGRWLSVKTKFVKLVVFVPLSHAERVRQELGAVGAGKIGKYSFASFSSLGVGRFLPGKGAHPVIGKVGKLTAVKEERIEVLCERAKLKKIIAAMKAAHPYEEVAFDIYSVENR